MQKSGKRYLNQMTKVSVVNHFNIMMLLNCGVEKTLETTPLLCLEGVPDLPVAPQDEAGLMKTFQTWPRGWFHIP